MLSIFLTLIPVFGIILIGAFSEYKKLLPEEAAKSINLFVYWFGLPMLLFYIMATTTAEQLSFGGMLGNMIGMFVVQISITLLFLFLKVSWKESLMAGLVACFANASFMGIPIVQLLYPDNPQVLTIAGLSTVVLTVHLITTDVLLTLSNTINQDKLRITELLLIIAKSLYSNPALIAVCAGILVGPVALPFHKSLLEIGKMIGTTAAPCALFCLGITLYRQLKAMRDGHKSPKGSARLILILLFAKLFMTPFFVALFIYMINGKTLDYIVMPIVSAVPTAVICSIIALKHNTFINMSANTTLIGTIVSLFTLPIVIQLITGSGF